MYSLVTAIVEIWCIFGKQSWAAVWGHSGLSPPGVSFRELLLGQAGPRGLQAAISCGGHLGRRKQEVDAACLQEAARARVHTLTTAELVVLILEGMLGTTGKT